MLIISTEKLIIYRSVIMNDFYIAVFFEMHFSYGNNIKGHQNAYFTFKVDKVHY